MMERGLVRFKCWFPFSWGEHVHICNNLGSNSSHELDSFLMQRLQPTVNKSSTAFRVAATASRFSLILSVLE